MNAIAQAIAHRQSAIGRLRAEIKALRDVDKLLGTSIFPQTDRNTKLIPNAVVSALEQLEGRGVNGRIVGRDIPTASNLKDHIQGVAIRDSYAMVTTSARGGFVLTAKGSGRTFTYETRKAVGDFDHPGGIQTIGDWLVVGVEDQGRSEIRFYRYRERLALVNRLTIVRNKVLGQAGSVGITNYGRLETERYLLATCPDDHRVHFYRTTQPGVPLSAPGCSFGTQPFLKWNAKRVPKSQRTNWKPDDTWGKYVNSIALLSDTLGKPYFIGLYRRNFRHYADLFVIDLDRRVLTKLTRVQVECKDGASFRWGASALVMSPTKLRLFACERDVQRRPKRIRLNIFAAEN